MLCGIYIFLSGCWSSVHEDSCCHHGHFSFGGSTCAPDEGRRGSGRMSLLFLVYVTDIVTFSLVSCSLPETHQEAVYGALFSFPCRVSASKSGRQLYSYVFYSVIFSPSRNETEEQRWRVEEKKPIRLGAIGILEGKTPSLNTSVTIFF